MTTESGLSPPNCANDPDEKEISDDDDDDRNHKHRKRDTRSHPLEGGDPLELGLSQPYRKRNTTFGNSNRGISKFDKRRTIGANSFGRGRGRDYQRDSTPMQSSHQGPMPLGMFSGRGLCSVPSAPWNNFGLIPMIPNGAIDVVDPLGMPIQGSRIDPLLNMGVQWQRCRDFEERGFCLRGDMCPMEHGVNRIVVEDVQSLSQFNLPVSLPSAHLMGTPTLTGFIPSVTVSPNTFTNTNGAHGIPNKSTMNDNALNIDGSFSVTANTCAPDVYDPDQPLWNNNGHDNSTQLFELQPPKFDTSNNNGHDNSTNSSVRGRLNNSSKSRLDLKGKFDTKSKSKEIPEVSSGTQVTLKQNNLPTLEPDGKKSGEKAHRTLFVNCIPMKDNKREKLLSHFRKFGEVIDIYIPVNSERAFVQFSKREEAERAVKAPDAVMGSRFIKLWWANRDNLPDEGVNNGGKNVSVTFSSVAHKGKDKGEDNGPKPTIGGGPKVGPPPLVQKKMDSLVNLKEELRKKQEMLEQKRNEFRLQLDKLAKQGTGAKSESCDIQAMKKHKVETSTQTLISEKSTNAVVSGSSSMQVEKCVNQTSSVEIVPSPHSKANSDPQSLKHAVHSVMSRVPSRVNMYKLDNRPTSFKICAPIPAGLANVSTLKDHFKIYGDVSNVEIDESNEKKDNSIDSDNSEATTNYSARVTFTTRHAAERAFLNGKSWQNYSLQFMWVNNSSSLRGVNNSEIQSKEKIAHNDSRDIIGPTPAKIDHKSSNESSNFIPLETDDHKNRDDYQAPEKAILSGEGEFALKAE